MGEHHKIIFTCLGYQWSSGSHNSVFCFI